MKSIAVIGASGFIGRALLQHCQRQNISVVATCRKPLNANNTDLLRWQRYELTDRPQPLLDAIAECEWVVCLAATAHVEAAAAVYQAEARAYSSLLDALLDAGKKVIYISSVKAVDGADEYSLAKRRIETHLQAHASGNWIILRPALVYGEGMQGFLGQWQRMLQAGWMPRLPVINNQRSLVSIDNLVSAIFFTMRQPGCLQQILVVTDRHAYSTTQLQQELMSALGREWNLPALPAGCWKALAYLGQLLPFLPFNLGHYQRLFADANYQDDLLAELGWWAEDDFESFCRRSRN